MSQIARVFSGNENCFGYKICKFSAVLYYVQVYNGCRGWWLSIYESPSWMQTRL